jgi:hypothetical protein
MLLLMMMMWKIYLMSKLDVTFVCDVVAVFLVALSPEIFAGNIAVAVEEFAVASAVDVVVASASEYVAGVAVEYSDAAAVSAELAAAVVDAAAERT